MSSGDDKHPIDVAALLDTGALLRLTEAAAEPISLMITQVQKARLRQMGYADADIFEMTPAAAHAVLKGWHSPA